MINIVDSCMSKKNACCSTYKLNNRGGLGDVRGNRNAANMVRYTDMNTKSCILENMVGDRQ